MKCVNFHKGMCDDSFVIIVRDKGRNKSRMAVHLVMPLISFRSKMISYKRIRKISIKTGAIQKKYRINCVFFYISFIVHWQPTMKRNGIYFIFIILEIVIIFPMSRAQQVTFLDDDIFRPVFRRMRNFFFNLNNYQTDDEIMRLSLKMNVS